MNINKVIQLALENHRKGDLKQAEYLYKKILKKQPDNADTLHMLGALFFQLANYDLAIRYIRKALQFRPSDIASAHYNLGCALEEKGQFDEAITHFLKAIEINPSFAAAYNGLGYAFQEKGQFDEAITHYQKAVELKPFFAEAWNNLGCTFYRKGQYDEAVACCHKALQFNPNLANAYVSLGETLKAKRQLDEAITSYQKALQLNPNCADAYNDLGTALQDKGQLDEAITSYQKALQLNPNCADAYNNLGTALQDKGQLDDAMTCYQKAIKLKPNFDRAYSNLGAAFGQKGHLDESVACCHKALQFNPNLANAYVNLGETLKAKRQLDEAITCYQKALQLNPNCADAYYNLGNTFKDKGQLDEAITCYQKALQLNPNLPSTYNNLGAVLQDKGQLDEAITSYQKALQLNPNYAAAYNNLGIALQDKGQLDEAIACSQKALQLETDFSEACNNLFHQLQIACAWQELKAMRTELDDLTRKALAAGTRTPEAPFISINSHADPSINCSVAKSRSRDIARTVSNSKIHFSFDVRKKGKTKIVVGYLSNDFRNHATAHLMLSLFGLHNRGEFEIYCYSYGNDDESYYRTRIQRDCDKFIDISGLSHDAAAKRIYEDQVDILVDLKGHTKGSRLEICALRPAPIQVNYLGFPGTIGADFFDYIITDKIVTPQNHSLYYSEKFVYMPHCYQVNDHMQSISSKTSEKVDLGVPEDCFLFCSFNQSFKIDPVMFEVWMKILARVPKGVLWLMLDNKTAEDNLRREAAARGIQSARLIIAEKLPKDEHLSRLRLADLALDTRIYNGHTTTSDALWAGVPVITIQGSHFASRVSSSILFGLGMSELITYSLEEYEALAVRLAHNPADLREIRQRIAKDRLDMPLFDTPRFVRNLETAYKEMWKICLAGESPRQIEVLES